MSKTQDKILAVWDHGEQLSVRQLADRLRMESRTVSKALVRMMHNGVVYRCGELDGMYQSGGYIYARVEQPKPVPRAASTYCPKRTPKPYATGYRWWGGG